MLFRSAHFYNYKAQNESREISILNRFIEIANNRVEIKLYFKIREFILLNQIIFYAFFTCIFSRSNFSQKKYNLIYSLTDEQIGANEFNNCSIFFESFLKDRNAVNLVQTNNPRLTNSQNQKTFFVSNILIYLIDNHASNIKIKLIKIILCLTKFIYISCIKNTNTIIGASFYFEGYLTNFIKIGRAHV